MKVAAKVGIAPTSPGFQAGAKSTSATWRSAPPEGISPPAFALGSRRSDILSFGGTKQGMMCGEAVIVLKQGLAGDFPYWQKNSMQLASKMRFIAAQFLALLEGDLWLANAEHANQMAQKLKKAVNALPYVTLEHPVEANALFVRLPLKVIEPLSRESFFWPWDPAIGLVRWMCSFDTESGDIDRFLASLRRFATELS